MKHIPALVSLILTLLSPAAAYADSGVIASIKPLHSLVAAVMGDTGKPDLIVGGMQSPHGYQLAPSQIEKLHQAKIIFYIAPSLETFLTRPFASLPSAIQKIALIDAPGIMILNPRAGGVWESESDQAPQAGQDPHIWLNVENAKAMTKEITRDLSREWPANKTIYERNAAALIKKLDALNAELKTRLKPARGKPYIVFHDAFHYFEKDYGLTAAGSITLEPEQEPSAERVAEIRKKAISLKAACVFSEPQFNSRLIQTITDGTDMKTGVLDEHGANLTEGPDLYFALMRNLADGFLKCLRHS